MDADHIVAAIERLTAAVDDMNTANHEFRNEVRKAIAEIAKQLSDIALDSRMSGESMSIAASSLQSIDEAAQIVARHFDPPLGGSQKR